MSQIEHDAEQVVESVLKMLGHARMRPGMYFAPIDYFAAQNFFGGVWIGVSCATPNEVVPHNSCRRDAERARGYRQYCADSEFESQVRARFQGEEQVVDELFEIEIDTWNRIREALKSKSGSTAVQFQ